MWWTLLGYGWIWGKNTEPKRSSRWPAVRKAHLIREPLCQLCGGSAELNAHHVLPFHLYPEHELDPTNLITLCNRLHCHLQLGHLGDFKAWNPQVRADAATMRERRKSRLYGRI